MSLTLVPNNIAVFIDREIFTRGRPQRRVLPVAISYGSSLEQPALSHQGAIVNVGTELASAVPQIGPHNGSLSRGRVKLLLL